MVSVMEMIANQDVFRLLMEGLSLFRIEEEMVRNLPFVQTNSPDINTER